MQRTLMFEQNDVVLVPCAAAQSDCITKTLWRSAGDGDFSQLASREKADVAAVSGPERIRKLKQRALRAGNWLCSERTDRPEPQTRYASRHGPEDDVAAVRRHRGKRFRGAGSQRRFLRELDQKAGGHWLCRVGSKVGGDKRRADSGQGEQRGDALRDALSLAGADGDRSRHALRLLEVVTNIADRVVALPAVFLQATLEERSHT